VEVVPQEKKVIVADSLLTASYRRKTTAHGAAHLMESAEKLERRALIAVERVHVAQ
jgi:hypothetical protein